MKRFVLCALALLPLGIAVADDLAEVRAKVTERFPMIQPENIVAGPIDGLLEIRQGTLVAYLTPDGRYLFQGDLIDLETDTNLTAVAQSEERQVMMSAVPTQNQVVFGPSKPAYSVAVFTDVECGFCRKLHREIQQYTDAGIEIRYLMYPRGGPGSSAWKTAENVLCAKDRNDAMTRAKNAETVDSPACPASAAVMEHYRLGQEVGLRGTPAIVLEDGELIGGYVPANELASRLAAAAKR